MLRQVSVSSRLLLGGNSPSGFVAGKNNLSKQTALQFTTTEIRSIAPTTCLPLFASLSSYQRMIETSGISIGLPCAELIHVLNSGTRRFWKKVRTALWLHRNMPSLQPLPPRTPFQSCLHFPDR